MKLVFSLLLVAASLIARADQTFLGRNDYLPQAEVENYFSGKLKAAFPDLRFSLSVTFRKPNEINLDILPGRVAVSDAAHLPLNQIANVKVLSNEDLSPNFLASVFGIRESQISSQKSDFPTFAKIQEKAIEPKPEVARSSESEIFRKVVDC